MHANMIIQDGMIIQDTTGRTSHPMVYEWIFSSGFAKPKPIFERHKTLKYSRTGPKRFMW